jgi:lipopolysaccharide/colanic/teichoic acid biosynthesis glycosyltransferase
MSEIETTGIQVASSESVRLNQVLHWWPTIRYKHIKRVLDIVLAVLLILLFGLLMLLIAAAIKLYSPGPIFFRQVRIGKDGRRFTMHKFRSMHVGNNGEAHIKHMQRLIQENKRPEELGAASLKMKNDSRITGIGRLLRKWGLDELPQFFDVLRGEMSLIGPRPPLPYEYELYDDWHKQRLQVLPGITGLWQVKAHNQVSFEDMVRLDLQYIATMSLWLDLKIMLLTPWEMMRGKGGG